MALSTQELDTLNAIFANMEGNDFGTVANMYKYAQSMRQHKAAVSFRVGDKVQWDSKYGRIEQGTIQKVNSKTIKVMTTSNQLWNVSPTLLRKA